MVGNLGGDYWSALYKSCRWVFSHLHSERTIQRLVPKEATGAVELVPRGLVFVAYIRAQPIWA